MQERPGPPVVRDITSGDWSRIQWIQSECYPPVANETVESLQSHWLIAPSLCQVAEIAGAVVGYIMAHPWPNGATPPLNTVYSSLPANSDSLFVHDLAVLKTARGTGTGYALAQSVMESARSLRLRSASLIAVQGSEPFWARFGFVAAAIPSEEYAAAVRVLYPQAAFSYMRMDAL